MFEFITTLIRRHILITLLLPVACALTGAALHRRDIDPAFAVSKVAALMNTVHANGNTGQQVQTFGEIANGLTTAVRQITP
jgi:hypothetical protein